jgi:hypothetical protein
MAKYTRQLTGDFQTLLQSIEQGILGGSVSASLEDSADFQTGGVRVAVRVFERYSWLGSNRLSLSVTLVGQGDRLFITGITSGGSQAVFFKFNTFGEMAFLDRFREIVDGF